MKIEERIMLESRYLISLNKNYSELAEILKISEKVIYDDLNKKLLAFDKELYEKVQKKLEFILNNK